VRGPSCCPPDQSATEKKRENCSGLPLRGSPPPHQFNCNPEASARRCSGAPLCTDALLNRARLYKTLADRGVAASSLNCSHNTDSAQARSAVYSQHTTRKATVAHPTTTRLLIQILCVRNLENPHAVTKRAPTAQNRWPSHCASAAGNMFTVNLPTSERRLPPPTQVSL
jgi:hypothetical protein